MYLGNRILFACLVGISGLIPGLASGSEDFSPGKEVLSQTAAVLRERYLDAELAAKLADAILAQEKAGAFAAAKTPEEFAKSVTVAMQTLVPDLHLRMSYEPTREFVPGTAPASQGGQQTQRVVRTNRIDGRDVTTLARTNFAFDALERFDGNIGYLRMSKFVPIDLSQPTVAAAFGFLANSDALIVDLRGNIGGSPDTVGFMLSHFFPADTAPILLHSAEHRATGVKREVRTDPALGRAGLAKAPLYILIDRNTASAAEMFAYAARRTGRGVVIGETSSGAGNGGRKYSVGGGFALFLSEWKILTGPGWERVGVRPDIEVDPAKALPAARKLALQALLARGDVGDDIRTERQRALDKL